MEKKDIVGIGRRKTSTARVFLTEGTGKILINSRDLLEYLQQSPVKVSIVKSPLSILGLDTKYDIKINIKGGGLSSQAGAIR